MRIPSPSSLPTCNTYQVNPSMAGRSRTTTSVSNTKALVRCPWQTRDQTPMVHNSFFARYVQVLFYFYAHLFFFFFSFFSLLFLLSLVRRDSRCANTHCNGVFQYKNKTKTKKMVLMVLQPRFEVCSNVCNVCTLL